jgi:hypothetical protein
MFRQLDQDDDDHDEDDFVEESDDGDDCSPDEGRWKGATMKVSHLDIHQCRFVYSEVGEIQKPVY